MIPTVNSGGIASASMRDTDQSLVFKQQEYIPPLGGAQKGGSSIKCKGKKYSKCSRKTCIWTSRKYCRKRGKMTCRGKTEKECNNVKINIPGLVPSVVGRCQYIHGDERNSCRRIRSYRKTAKKTGGRR